MVLLGRGGPPRAGCLGVRFLVQLPPGARAARNHAGLCRESGRRKNTKYRTIQDMLCPCLATRRRYGVYYFFQVLAGKQKALEHEKEEVRVEKQRLEREVGTMRRDVHR